MDLDIQAAGTPIRISCTYDTRHRGDVLDLGHGWAIDYQGLRIQHDKRLVTVCKLKHAGHSFADGLWPVRVVTCHSMSHERLSAIRIYLSGSGQS